MWIKALDAVHQRRIRPGPAVEDGMDAVAEGTELWVVADGRTHLLRLDQRVGIARARVRPEERGADARHDIPELGQQVDVPVRHAALQMRLDVLKILGIGAVDVARDVEVEVVARDLGVGDEARVASDRHLAGIGVGDLVDVALPQAVLGAVLHEPP